MVAALLSAAQVAQAQFQTGTLNPVVGGLSVQSYAVAADGDTVVTGNYGAIVNGMTSGAAVIFKRVGGAWSQEAVLAPNDPQSNMYFGWAVAISGSRAFVSALNGAAQPGAGAVYVYRRTGSFPFATWDQIAKLTAPDATANQYFGTSIAASGSTLLVGCVGPGAQGWASYFFEQQNGSWQLSERLPVPARFGTAVGLDGDKAAISMTQYNAPYGEVRTFGRSASGWQFEASLVPPPSENDDTFGRTIALKSGLLVVGQHGFRGGTNTRQGRIVLSRSLGSTWTNLVALDWLGTLPESEVGKGIATNGSDVIAYAPYVVQGTSSRGALAVARWPLGAALPDKVGVVTPPTATYPHPWGETAAIVGTTAFLAGNDAVDIVSLTPPPPATYCTGKLNSAGCVATVSSAGSASATSNSSFNISANSVVSGKNGLLFFGSSGRTAFPFQGGYLCALPPTRRTLSQPSGGNTAANDCSGNYSYDFNALIRSGVYADLVPGIMVNAQYWYRDPAAPSTTGLTNALEFGIGF
jgi:hypothetical protein